MKTLQVIETIEELSDCFRSGQLKGCWLFWVEDEDSYGDTTIEIELRGTSDYTIADELNSSTVELVNKLLVALGIPTEDPG